jgi:hypothetical protein
MSSSHLFPHPTFPPYSPTPSTKTRMGKRCDTEQDMLRHPASSSPHSINIKHHVTVFSLTCGSFACLPFGPWMQGCDGAVAPTNSGARHQSFKASHSCKSGHVNDAPMLMSQHVSSLRGRTWFISNGVCRWEKTIGFSCRPTLCTPFGVCEHRSS